MNISKTKIQLMLAEQGLTRTALATSCGISRQGVCTILARGTCAPKNAGKLARALGVDVDELLEEVK